MPVKWSSRSLGTDSNLVHTTESAKLEAVCKLTHFRPIGPDDIVWTNFFSDRQTDRKWCLGAYTVCAGRLKTSFYFYDLIHSLATRYIQQPFTCYSEYPGTRDLNRKNKDKSVGNTWRKIAQRVSELHS